MKRGRKSAAQLAVAMVDASHQMPPEPPPVLTEEQALVWRETVASLPGDFIQPAAFPVLAAYCRHVCRAQLAEELLAQLQLQTSMNDVKLRRLERLLVIAERETRAMTACARSLRLTPQAQMHPLTAGRALANCPQIVPPWLDV